MANETAEQAILNKLAQAPSFHPAGAKLFVPDWTLDSGDVVTVTAKDNVNDPDETPTSYNVPIYSMNLTWNGTSRVEIESTGNQQREPLSALRRKEYQAGRRGYGQFKEIDDEFKEFETWQTQTDEVIGTYAAQFVDILGDGTNEGRLTLAETAIEQTASDATITAQAAGILLDEDGHPILDERGKYQYDPNAADTTLIAQINTNATEILAKVSQSDLNTTLASYLQINAFSTELASTLDNGDTTLAAKIITAVNKNTNTSSVVISADQINLDGVVSAVFLDSRMANIDKLFTSEGTALEITAGTANIMNLNWLSGDSDSDAVGLKTIRVNGVAPTNIGFLGIGSDTILDINTVGIVSASVSNNILTLTDTAGNHVNFSKATSVSGEWGSNQQGQPTGVFTVTATQTNRNTTTGLDEPTTVGTVLTSITQAGHWGNTNNQEDPNTYYQSTNATIDTRQTLYAVKTAEINAAGRFYAGKNSVGLAPMSYTEFQGENYPASQTIYTDTTGRTDASGATDNLHRDITLSLDVDDSYVYMKHGSDIIARISNSGGSAGYNEGYTDGQSNADAVINSISHPAGDISYLASRLNIDIYSNPNLVLTSQEGIVTYIEKTGMTDTIQIPVTVTSVSLSKGVISKENDYTGTYTITGDAGNVNIDGQNGANIPVGVNSLPLSLTLGTPNTDLGTTGTARWSDENHNYVYSVNSSLTVDGTGNVLTRTVSGITLNPEKAIEYGQSTVSAILTGATSSSGDYQTLSTGTYGLYLTKNNTPDTNPIAYYRVTTGGSVNYVVSSNGATVMAWNGLTLVGSIYPNTDVTLGSTDQLGRRQVSYNGKSGYVSTSNISTSKGPTNYSGRIGWVGDESDPSTRTVVSLSNVVLTSSQATTSEHDVTVTYSDGNVVQGGARITVDASAISGGGGGGEGGVRNTSKYAESSESSDWSDWSASFNGTQTLSEKYAYIKVNANDDTVYNLGINASSVWHDGYTVGKSETSPYEIEDLKTVTYTTNGTRTITPSGTNYAMRSVKVNVSVSTAGGVSSVSKYAESDYSSDWNDWVFDSTQSISSKYANFTINGNDGSTYKFGVNASGLLETNRTIKYTSNGTKTLYPASKLGMEKATITIDVPQSTASLGTKSFSSNGTYSASSYGYDGFSSVTVNVASTLPKISVGSLRSGSAPQRDKYVTVNKGTTNYVIITAGTGNTYQLEIRANS